MKTVILITIVSFLGFSISLSQNVNIPDIAFLNAQIEEGVDTNAYGLINYAEAESVTSLDISDENISDMTGIEAFINLEALNCGSNQPTSLDVSKNMALLHMECHQNQLTNIDVSNNTALLYLHCGGRNAILL